MNITTTVNANKRYYIDEPLVENGGTLMRSISQFNDMKIVLYNELYNKSVFKGNSALDKKTHSSFLKDYAKKKGYSNVLSDYYTCAVYAAASGCIKSQRELRKFYIENKKAAIKSVKTKIKEDEERLAKKTAIKAALKEYAIHGRWKCPYRGCPLCVKKGAFSYRGKVVDPLALEQDTERDIHKLKARIPLLKDRQNKLEKQLADLRDKPFKRIVFGTRKQYAKKDSISEANIPDTEKQAQMQAWKEDFRFSRARAMCLPGRHTSKDCNFLVKLVDGDLHVTNIDGSVTVFRDFLITRYGEYHSANLNAAPSNRRAMAYNFTLHKDKDGRLYFIVSVTMQLTNDQCNSGFADGCISIDLNWDNVCLSDITAKGELIDRKVISFNLEGKRSGHNADIIGAVAKQVSEWCNQKKKPLVMEKLDTTVSKAGSRYGSKKGNRHMSLFASKKLTACICNQGFRNDFEVYFIDPAYTSQAGKVLFMRQMGSTIHEAASYCIGLKGMGLYDKLLPAWFLQLAPPVKKKQNTFEAVWKSFVLAFKGIKTHTFYRDIRKYFDDLVKKNGRATYKDAAKILKAIDGGFPA